MKPHRHWIILMGGLWIVLSVTSGRVEAQDTWSSQLVGNDTWWNSREAFSDPEHLSCGDEYVVGLVLAGGLYVDSVNLRCAELDNGWKHLDVHLASASPAGGEADLYVSEEKDFRCDSGEVVAGFKGKAGDYLDRLQVGCRALGEETVRWLPTAGGEGGTNFGPLTCPSGMGVDRMSVWSMEAYGSAGITYRWIPYSITKLTFRCKTLPGTLPVQQVGGQIDYAVEEPLQTVGGQLDVAIGEASGASAPAAPGEEDPAAPPSPSTEPAPAPAESGEMSVPAPEPAPPLTPRTPALPPGVVSPQVEVPVRQPIPGQEPPDPAETAPADQAQPAPDSVNDSATPMEPPPAIVLSLKPGSVRGGETVWLTIRLSQATAAAEEIVLTTGAPELAQVPERATIESGRQEVRVEVTTTGSVERPTSVPIRASFGNGHQQAVEVVLQIRPDPAGKGRGRPDTDDAGQGPGRDGER